MFRRLSPRSRRAITRLLTPNYTLGAVAVCVDEQRGVLLLRSRQHAGWGLPGGLVGRGETPEQGLARELDEEVGIEVTARSLASAARHTLVDSVTQQVTVVLEVALAGTPTPDGVEVVEARWFALDELPARLVSGTLESLRLAGVVGPA